MSKTVAQYMDDFLIEIEKNINNGKPYTLADLDKAKRLLDLPLVDACDIAAALYAEREAQMERILSLLASAPELYGDEWAARIRAWPNSKSR